MSGHSKWSTIKRKKGAADAKRGQVFTKLGKVITLAARDGGGDSRMNFALRLAMDKAKEANMPSNNIDRAVKRGTGESDENYVLEKAVYGGYGPGGVAVVVDVTTDNKNRAVSELRQIFEAHGGNLAEASSVLWQFEEKGRIVVKCGKIEKSEKFGGQDKFVPAGMEDVMMSLMEIPQVEDLKEMPSSESGGEVDMCEVYCRVADLKLTRDAVEKIGYVIEEFGIARVPSNPQALSDEDAENIDQLLEALSESDDVDDVWVNSRS